MTLRYSSRPGPDCGSHGMPVEEPDLRTLIHRWGLPALLALPTAAAWSASEHPSPQPVTTTPAPATQTAAPASAPAQPTSPVGRQLVQLTRERLAAVPALAASPAAAATIAEPAAPA